MILDFPRIVALSVLVLIGGGFGVIELLLKRRRSPRGGIRWLVMIFTIDAAVALLAYLVLDAALADEVWTNQIEIYVAAIVWSPFLLRAQYEFLVPGPSAKDFFRVLPASRDFLASRVNIGSANYLSNWMAAKLVPRIQEIGVDALRARAEDFLRNLHELPDTKVDELIVHIQKVEDDSDTAVEKKIRSIAQTLIENNGYSLLRAIAKET
jgi:hypothetical protein